MRESTVTITRRVHPGTLGRDSGSRLQFEAQLVNEVRRLLYAQGISEQDIRIEWAVQVIGKERQ